MTWWYQSRKMTGLFLSTRTRESLNSNTLEDTNKNTASSDTAGCSTTHTSQIHEYSPSRWLKICRIGISAYTKPTALKSAIRKFHTVRNLPRFIGRSEEHT